MSEFQKRLCFVISSIMLMGLAASAEPWISNRYAQNCAACHAPSRRNLPVSKRRCTLSCQGCHVNPSGGGMRNSYGVWNQRRWLRSFKSDLLKSKGTPAPLRHQKYAKMPKHPKGKYLKKMNKLAKEGPDLVVVKGVDYHEDDYDRSDAQEHITARSRSEFLARVTKDDPWRIERTQDMFAGVDFRYFYLDVETDVDGAKTSYTDTLPMALDLGVRFRPIPEKLQVVFEHRYLNTPNRSNSTASRPDNQFVEDSQVRSAYVLVDDLPYASYAQVGIYRPMFGNVTADHTSLANTMIWDDRSGTISSPGAQSSKFVNRVFSVGGSPNVPFYNLHMIKPLANSSEPQDNGFAANLGGRWVMYGLSAMLSYWNTQYCNTAGCDLDKKMVGFNVGGTWKGIIVNYDTTTIERETQPGNTNKATVDTLEVKYRVWREVYAQFNVASANTAPNLFAGSGDETMYGVKSFLYPGTEFEVMIVNRKYKYDGGSVYKNDYLQAQMHLYF